jgi:hypothetical protein
MAKAIIMQGNLSEGYRPVGPFVSFAEASSFDADVLGGGNWILIMRSSEDVLEALLKDEYTG